MYDLKTLIRSPLCRLASFCLEAKSWKWADRLPLGSTFWCSQEVLAYTGKPEVAETLNFPYTEQGLPSYHILVWEILPAQSICGCHPGEGGREPDFSMTAPWLPCHALAHVGPTRQAFWSLSQEVFLWWIRLNCFFLGGLRNQAPLEDLKENSEILWSAGVLWVEKLHNLPYLHPVHSIGSSDASFCGAKITLLFSACTAV